MSDESGVQLIAQLDRIAEKLNRLREADRAFSVFGSDSHGYHPGPKLKERDLLAVEQRLGIRLPQEYRLFLAHLGWQDPCSQEDVWCDDAQVSGNPQIVLMVPGALSICNYGCGIGFFLVVNGPRVGEVWRDSQSDEAGILPECGADGRHLGFLDWYENWLNEAIRLAK